MQNLKSSSRRVRGKHRPGEMNKIETDYSRVLEKRRLDGEIKLFHYESIKLILAPKLSYTPDFFVLNKNDEGEFHEVKGHWEEKAWVKFKMAAEKFPFAFFIVKKVKKEWDIKEYCP